MIMLPAVTVRNARSTAKAPISSGLEIDDVGKLSYVHPDDISIDTAIETTCITTCVVDHAHWNRSTVVNMEAIQDNAYGSSMK